MKNSIYLLFELILLYICIPVSLLFGYPIYLKIGFITTGLSYILYVYFKMEKRQKNIPKKRNITLLSKQFLIPFLILIFLTTSFVYIKDSSKLFCMPLYQTGLWAFMIGVYTFFSVYPQEFVYRTFFFNRYEKLFKNKKLLIFTNAILFSLAHLFFKNIWVLVITFIGGLLFAYSFYKSRSLLQVSLEHALYGNWLFTVGLGQMFAFPGMDSC
jgi:membrane protease YdiL (CAAX protease family)